MKEPKLCAICEEILKEKDLDAVCLDCYRKAREPKKAITLVMTEEDRAGIGMAFALGGFLCAGLQALYEWSLEKKEKKAGEPAPRKPEKRETGRGLRRRLRAALRKDIQRLEDGLPPGPKAS